MWLGWDKATESDNGMGMETERCTYKVKEKELETVKEMETETANEETMKRERERDVERRMQKEEKERAKGSGGHWGRAKDSSEHSMGLASFALRLGSLFAACFGLASLIWPVTLHSA